VGLTVTVPLFDGFLTHYNIEQAKATVEVKEGQLRQVRQATLMAVVQAYADSQSALGNVKVSEAFLIATQAALESSQHRYSQGAADIVELLNAQEALADARMERTRSLADWRSERLRLLASAGVLDRADIAN
jgi:outer membrane protein